MIYVGNNVYHVGNYLPPLINALNNIKENGLTDYYDDFLNSIDDFYNSYNFNKDLLLDLINELIDEYNGDFQDNLIFLKSLYEYYDSYLDYKKELEKNYYIYLLSFNQNIDDETLKNIKLVLNQNELFVFDYYNQLDKTLEYTDDDLENKLINLGKNDNNYTELTQYLLSKIISDFLSKIEVFSKAKYNLYILTLDKIDNNFTNNIINLTYSDNIDYSSNKILDIVNSTLISTVTSFQEYSTDIYDKETLLNEMKNNIEEINYNAVFIIYLDNHQINLIKTKQEKDTLEEIDVSDNVNNLNDLSTQIETKSNEIDNNNSITEDDYNELKTLGKEVSNNTSPLMVLKNTINNINNINKQLNVINTNLTQKIITNLDFSNDIITYNNKLNLILTNYRDFFAIYLNNLINSSEIVKNIISVLSDLITIINAINSPYRTIQSLLNLLINPLEAVLYSINKDICAIKDLLCLLDNIAKAFEKNNESIITQIEKITKKENSDSILDTEINNSKTKFSNTTKEQYIENLKNYQNSLGQFLYPYIYNKLGEEKANNFIKANNEVFDECVNNLSFLDALDNEINNTFEDLKNSAENTINNIINMTNLDKCSYSKPYLPDLDFRLKPSDLSLKIPKLDSKIIKCY